MIEWLSITPEIDGWMFLLFTGLACFTAAFGVVAGLGGGVLLIGIMAMVFPPVALIPVHGVVQAGSNVTRTIIAHRLVMKSAILPFAAGALLGSVAGGSIVVSLPVALMQAILGVFMIYVCWSPKITAGKPTHTRFFALGTVGAFISMFIGATGTILAPWVRGVSDDRRVFVATHSCIMMFIHGLKVVVFVWLGFEFMKYLPLMAAMVAAGFLGNWIGFKLLDRMPEEIFRRVFQIALTLLSIRLLWSAAENSGYFG
ncbi:MAG: sulfite exporter TauE/SafE family protein [Rhodospirillaceae bacterium]